MSFRHTPNFENTDMDVERSEKAITDATNLLLDWLITQSEHLVDTEDNENIKNDNDLARSKKTDYFISNLVKE